MYAEGNICPICGERRLRSAIQDEQFEYKGKVLSLRLTCYSCDRCGESFFDNAEMKACQKTMKDFQRKVDNLLTSDEIRQIREKRGLSQREFARILGIAEKSFTKYELGLVSQSRAMDNLLRIIDHFPETLTFLKDLKQGHDKKELISTVIEIGRYRITKGKINYKMNEESISSNNDYELDAA